MLNFSAAVWKIKKKYLCFEGEKVTEVTKSVPVVLDVFGGPLGADRVERASEHVGDRGCLLANSGVD